MNKKLVRNRVHLTVTCRNAYDHAREVMTIDAIGKALARAVPAYADRIMTGAVLLHARL
jgi:hypothetical protein